MSAFNSNPSSYEGRILEENYVLKDALAWCVEMIDNHVQLESCHGGCSPATPCDGMCMDAYYFYKDFERIRSLIKTEI
jgi:hypothetical protein